MSLQERIEALRGKHQALEHAIDEESTRPHPDDVRITTLKKQKLRIKEQIEGIRVT